MKAIKYTETMELNEENYSTHEIKIHQENRN